MHRDAKIYIAGHRGLVGSAIQRNLEAKGYGNFLLRTHKELDLEIQRDVWDFFEKERPEYVFLAAAKVGGIIANNTWPADFIYNNLLIEVNIVNASHIYGVKKLLFLGSSCIYPKLCPQPMKEEYLLSGPLEPTNEPYAVAKIAGIKLCQSYNRQYGTNYISVMPTNLFGPNDNFDLTSSHVLPAMIRKFDDAKVNGEQQVVLWGTGAPYREFLHVDDLADACVFLMHHYDGSEIVNIGTGQDVTIKELAVMVKEIVGFGGEVVWDSSKPDGTPRKLLDVSRLHSLGWHAKTGLREGVGKTYDWYVKHCSKLGANADTV